MRTVLRALAVTFNPTAAARAAGTTKYLVDGWRTKSREAFEAAEPDMISSMWEKWYDRRLTFTVDGRPFHEAYRDAVDEAADHLESDAYLWAKEGIPEPLTYQGQITWLRHPDTLEVLTTESGAPIPLTIPKKSEKLMALMLRGLRPERYGAQIKVDTEVKASGVLVAPMHRSRCPRKVSG